MDFFRTFKISGSYQKVLIFLLTCFKTALVYLWHSVKLATWLIRYFLHIYQGLSNQKKTFSKETPLLVTPNEVKQKPLTNKTSIIEAKKILETWLNENKTYPYASKTELAELSLRSQLDEKKIIQWLNNKRSRSKELMQGKCFTKDDKQILLNFLTTRTDHPGPEDLSLLAKIIKKDEKKIRTWFSNQRYKAKLKCNE